MTALFSATVAAAAGSRSADPRHRRPLVLVATLGGLSAAGSTLLVLGAVGVIGWFVTDAGLHGAPRDGLRVAALAWLAAHGSGVQIQGSPVTMLPLGISAICGWVTWRLGHRVGDAVSGHGPDAEGIANGDRDWTVATATTLFTAAYVVMAALTGALAATARTAPSVSAALFGAFAGAVVLGGAGIAVGSGRAAIVITAAPMLVRAATAGARRIVTGYLLLSAAVLFGALVVDFSTAATIVSRLQSDTGDTVLFVLATAVVLPNAVVFTGSFLLGPGFSVGAHTLVSPTLVVLGPLPLFPLIAALPEQGVGPQMSSYVVAGPVLLAAWATGRNHLKYPTLSWFEGLVRGGAAGVLAGLAFGLLATMSGGAVGPGRLAQVGPFAFDVLTHGVAYFGIGGLLGAAMMTWWCRRATADARSEHP
jgi:Family of unknown function (DUF6350)